MVFLRFRPDRGTYLEAGQLNKENNYCVLATLMRINLREAYLIGCVSKRTMLKLESNGCVVCVEEE